MKWKWTRTVWTLLFLSWGTPSARADEPAAVDYTTHIAPLLQKYCASCHNADDREGLLSLESFADLQLGGKNGPALLPGQSGSSRLIRQLTGLAEPKMPPEDNEAPTESEIELLRAWIDLGAQGPDGAEPDRRRLVTPTIEPVASGQQAITTMAVSPRGGLVALARFGRIDLQASDGKLVHQIAGLPGKVNAVHFSRDGSRLITASGITGLYGQATIWDVTDGRRLQDFMGHRDTLYDAELSPNGKLLATCSYDHKISIWDADTGEQVRMLQGHNGAVYDLAFSPDGLVLATASGDETIKLWQLETGLRLDTLSQPQAEQYTVAFSPDGRYVLAGGGDNRIRVWRFVSRNRRQINPLVYARFAHEGAVTGLAFSPDGGLLVSVAEDKTVKLWETERFTQLHRYEQQTEPVTGVAVLASGQELLLSSSDGSTRRLPIVARNEAPASSQVVDAESAAQPVGSVNRLAEHEPNDLPQQAMHVFLPARIEGVVQSASVQSAHDGQPYDADLFRFDSKAGQQWVVEVNAARNKSPLDSKIEILDERGNAIPRMLLQAVRDSYFTFRGTDSDTSDGLRLHNWEEMEVNEYLYANGEVVKLWHYPRGPDSGFQVYPGKGKRWTYFDTTPISHALHEPCYIVQPRLPGTPFIPNGLPVVTVYFENDDDSLRRWGADSRLIFQAPADGRYLLRITDARGFGGSDYKYDLVMRPRRPDFNVKIEGANPTVNAGSGKEFSLTLERLDGFDGEVRIDITGLPPGFRATAPLVIEAGQQSAVGAIYATADPPQPTAENAKSSKVTASAVINGQKVTRQVGTLGEIKLAGKPKLLIRLLKIGGADLTQQAAAIDQPLELVVAPGETIAARVQIERHGFEGRVGFGRADSGRNLPHGVYVDNIGLNGLLIVEGQDQRTFYITATTWVPETTRMFYLRADAEGNQTSWPVILHVRAPDAVARNR